MLLVVNLMGKIFKRLLKPWHMDTHLRGLSKSYIMNYQHDMVQMFFKNRHIVVLWIKVALALEGLNGAPFYKYGPVCMGLEECCVTMNMGA